MSDHLFPNASASMAAWLARGERQEITVVDSHTAGNPTRIVLDGLDVPPHVRGVDATRAWLREHADHWRRRLVHEPRGGGLTCAVLPVATDEDGCDIGAVIMEPGSYPPMCGHCMIGFATVITELGLLPQVPAGAPFRIRTPAGPVTVQAIHEAGQAPRITLTNVESYVVAQWQCTVEGRALPVELLYGGDYYLAVDADRIGLSLARDNAIEIVRLARALREAATEPGIRDPLSGEHLDVYQVLFYHYDPRTPLQASIVVVAPPGVIDRSPCGTGTSALFAKLVSEGHVQPDQQVTTQSIIGSTFSVTAHHVRSTAQRLYVTPAVTGQAFINGFLTIAADAHDALADGFAPL